MNEDIKFSYHARPLEKAFLFALLFYLTPIIIVSIPFFNLRQGCKSPALLILLAIVIYFFCLYPVINNVFYWRAFRKKMKENPYPIMLNAQYLRLDLYLEQEIKTFSWQEIIGIFPLADGNREITIVTNKKEVFSLSLEDIKDWEKVFPTFQRYWQKYAPENAKQMIPKVEELKKSILGEAFGDERALPAQKKRGCFDFFLLIISAFACYSLLMFLISKVAT